MGSTARRRRADVHGAVERLSLRQFAPVALLIGVLALAVVGVWQIGRSWRDATRGLLIFARNQKDLIVDTDLVERSYSVKNDPAVIERLRLQTVIVATYAGNHHVYMGAGVIVAQRRGMLTILTAKHLLTHHGRHFVLFREGLGRYAKTVALAGSEDLAIVRVRAIPGVPYAVAGLARRDLRTGQTFTVMGHPGAREWLASPGIAERHRTITLLFCPTCDRGDSGAGAFTSADKLDGIVVKKARIAIPSFRRDRGAIITAFEIERLDAIRPFLKTQGVRN